jgi:structural maintenance of chromosome 4
MVQLSGQTEPNTADIARIRVLGTEISETHSEIEKLQGSTANIEASIKELEQKILDIGGSKMLAQKSKVDGIRLRINLSNDEITRAEVGKAKCDKDRQKYKSALETNTEALAELEASLAGIDEQLAECQETLNNIRSKVEEAQIATDHAKEDLEDLKSELDEQMKVIQKFRAKEVSDLMYSIVA